MNGKVKRIIHDLKRISNAMKMLTDELDALYVDVDEITKEESDGNDT